MCGIAGFIDGSRSRTVEELHELVGRMAATLSHRGPDDDGWWVDAACGVALGHRRLAVIDLSVEGHQPMVSSCGRFILVFNGEIYNFRSVRAQIESAGAAPPWRGHSDTEVMLAAFSAWGVDKALERFNGMFAFALWDRRERSLYLARDRLGEKPLYYGWAGGVFLFSSELKAMRAHPAFYGELDRNALALYFRHNYVPAPYSIYQGIRKLPAATYLRLPLGKGSVRDDGMPTAYWSAREIAESGTDAPFGDKPEACVQTLDTLLRKAVRLRMVADVPLGAFLSGGIDSSIVVALMQAQSSRAVRTFTIGFHEVGYNEAQHAKAIARHLGTDHTELYVTAEEAMAVIPDLPRLYDEPFGDASQIPTFLVSRLARTHVTVSLSGDGGDELFGGYVRYFQGRNLWRKVGWLPRWVRVAAGQATQAVPPAAWRALLHRLGRLAPRELRSGDPGDRLHKLAGVLSAGDPEALYLGLVSHWHEPAKIVHGAEEPKTALVDRGQWARLSDFTQRMMFLDTITYLPDDILVKVDRAAMGVSLESRVPLLDPKVVEFAWRLPLNMKIRRGQGKWLLRQLLFRYVPKDLIERPKMGFGVPVDSWLRGPLGEWAADLLSEERLRSDGLLNVGAVRERWREHLSGNRNWQYPLWDVLMFQAWLEEQKAPSSAGNVPVEQSTGA